MTWKGLLVHRCPPSTECTSHDVSNGQNRFPEHNGLPRRDLFGHTTGRGLSTEGLGRSEQPVVGSPT
jgi:hypothetical protein